MDLQLGTLVQWVGVLVLPALAALAHMHFRGLRNEQRIAALERASVSKDELRAILAESREEFRRDVMEPIHQRLSELRSDVRDVRERLIKVESKVLNGKG